MEKEVFRIQGGRPLEGEVVVRGAKNAAGPILIASLLTNEPCQISNLPLIKDVLNTLEVLKSLGAKVEWKGEREVRIQTERLTPEKMNFDQARETRISVLFIGALLARLSSFKMVRPGGDRIGLRPISTHLKALEKLGATVSFKDDFYFFEKKPSQVKQIVLSEFSVTATENLLLASVLSSEKIVIKGAAMEPQVQDLIHWLQTMGAKIKIIGSHSFLVEGVKSLKGGVHFLIPDPLEAGTFIVAGALTPGKVIVKDIIPDHLTLFLNKLEEIGVNFKIEEKGIMVAYSPKIQKAKVQALPYPGFPTDLLPIIVPLLLRAEGKSLIHDPLYENRLRYVDELRKMGADIEMVDPHRAFVFGPSLFRGARIESSDIRAGASLILAGLMADGITTIDNIGQIDRGYEKIEERLSQLGADIQRVKL
jgi:UDP-N-acetylglucosamine 1-carboxyvinyltransferase